MSSGGGGGSASVGGSESDANLFYGDESSTAAAAAAAVATATPTDNTTNSAQTSRQSSTTQQQTTSNRASNTNTIGMWRDPNAPNVPTTNGFEPNDDFDSDQLDEDEESYSWASTDNQDLITGGHSRHLNNRRHGSNSPSGGITGAGPNGLSFGSTQLPNWRDWKQPPPATQPGHLILPNTTNVSSSSANRTSSSQLNDYLMNMLTRNSNGPLGFPPGVTAATTTTTTNPSPSTIFQTIPQMNVSFFNRV